MVRSRRMKWTVGSGGWGSHTRRARKDSPGPLPRISQPSLQEICLPALAQPPACGYHLTEFFQALGLSFSSRAAQNIMERLGIRETVNMKLNSKPLHVHFHDCLIYSGYSKILLQQIF